MLALLWKIYCMAKHLMLKVKKINKYTKPTCRAITNILQQCIPCMTPAKLKLSFAQVHRHYIYKPIPRINIKPVLLLNITDSQLKFLIICFSTLNPSQETTKRRASKPLSSEAAIMETLTGDLSWIFCSTLTVLINHNRMMNAGTKSTHQKIKKERKVMLNCPFFGKIRQEKNIHMILLPFKTASPWKMWKLRFTYVCLELQKDYSFSHKLIVVHSFGESIISQM